jgi:hypothetical protein
MLLAELLNRDGVLNTLLLKISVASIKQFTVLGGQLLQKLRVAMLNTLKLSDIGAMDIVYEDSLSLFKLLRARWRHS